MGRVSAFSLTLGLALVPSLPLAAAPQPGATASDRWTPVVAEVLTPSAAVVPTVDGLRHLVYELKLLNASRSPANLSAVEVLGGRKGDQILAAFEGPALTARLRTLANGAAADSSIPPDQARLVLVDLTLPQGSPAPARLLHRLRLSGSTGPGPGPAAELTYKAAPLVIEHQVAILGPPLKGPGWVAINGCCRPDGGHRSTGLPIDGQLAFAQRFAVDWMRLDREGRLAVGDLGRVASYPSFGAEVIAVADGDVVAVRNDQSDQVPPKLPDPSLVSLANALGNFVVLHVGPEAYALYAHLQPGTVQVRAGQRVKRGQSLGLLGNSGNSSAPHLHFHLMSGPSLGSDGLPYVINRFALAGQIPEAEADALFSFKGSWSKNLAPKPSVRSNQLPLSLSIIDFPEAKPAP
jgi:hypothetical protein